MSLRLRPRVTIQYITDCVYVCRRAAGNLKHLNAISFLSKGYDTTVPYHVSSELPSPREIPINLRPEALAGHLTLLASVPTSDPEVTSPSEHLQLDCIRNNLPFRNAHC